MISETKTLLREAIKVLLGHIEAPGFPRGHQLLLTFQ